MSTLVAVFCKYYSVPFTKDGITSTMQVLKFHKIFADGTVRPASTKLMPTKIVDWLKRDGFIECGCVVGEQEDLGCMWIVSAEYHAGKRPENFSRILGLKLQSASVAFYPPARLGTSIRAGAIRSARAHNSTSQADLGIQRLDNERLLRSMGLIL